MRDTIDRVKRVLIGRPIRSEALGHQLLPKKLALPVFASDALSSVAYAPDEVLLTLALAGGIAGYHSLWVGVAVVGVLAVVVLSYRQTVHAYPSGGGDYEVVSTNLGHNWGLVVASALLVDYILTVAVSISAGSRYITAAIPSFVGYEVSIAVGLVVILSVLNLRGMREAGAAFAIPTYIYMAAIGLLIIAGFYQLLTGQLSLAESAQYELVPDPTHVDGIVGLGGAFLMMRAFSSGCAALTGVEAISNGVPSFAPPKSKNAATTLALLGGIAAVMMMSILVLSRATGIILVEDPQTQLLFHGAAVGPEVALDPAIGQLAATIFGEGSILFILITVVTGAILVLAANTAFNGFPTLASVLSRDSFLPRQLYKRGDRLAYSNGIIVLAIAAIAFIVAFDAEVTRLIQLYVVGVFVSFTLSQLGMIRHWNRQLRTRQTGAERGTVLRSRAVNIIGFMMTGMVLAIVLVTKFTHGAWITLIMMSVVFIIQRLIRGHYDQVRADLRVEDWNMQRALPTRVHAIVLVSNFARPTMRAVSTARASGPSSLELVSVVADENQEALVRSEWEESGLPTPLTLLYSPYRDVTHVVETHVRALRRRRPNELVIVYLPAFLVRRWWQNILHNQTALRLRRALLHIPGVVITTVPWQLGEDDQVEGRQLVNDPFPGNERSEATTRVVEKEETQ